MKSNIKNASKVTGSRLMITFGVVLPLAIKERNSNDC